MIENKELKCGFKMPVFGMGTWMMGGNSERDAGNNGDADAAALIAGLERGLSHIDTAEMYAGGFAEEIVGRAIAGRKRAKLFITTKVWNTNLSFDGVLRAAEGSLKRLGTDCIDLYLVHKPNDDIPLKETIRALDRLQDEKSSATPGSVILPSGDLITHRRCPVIRSSPIKCITISFSANLKLPACWITAGRMI